MTIYKIRAGRVPGIGFDSFVGIKDTLFYDTVTGDLRISDGQTAGGLPSTLSNVVINFQNISDFSIPGGSNGQVLTTDGNGNLSWSNSSGTADTGSWTFDTVTATTDGNIIVKAGSGADAWASLLSNNGANSFWVDDVGAHVTSNFVEGETTENYWTFGADGKLTLPNGASIGSGDSLSGIPMTTDRGTVLFGNQPEQCEPLTLSSHFHIMKQDPGLVDLFFGDDFNYVKLPTTDGVEIGTNVGNGANTWRFGTDGKLSLPGFVEFPDSSVQETAYRYSASDAAPTVTTGALWFNTEEGKLYVNYNNVWTDANPTEIDPSAIRFNNLNQIELPEGGDIVDSNGDTVFSNTGDITFNANEIGVDGNNGEIKIKAVDGDDYSYTWQTSKRWEAYAENDELGDHPAWAWIKADMEDGINNPKVFIENVAGNTGIEQRWTFGSNGIITLPNGMTIDSYGTLGVNATVDIGGDNTRISIDNNGAPPGLYITTDASGTPKGWHFGPDGDLTLPQFGAFTSPNYGFSFNKNSGKTGAPEIGTDVTFATEDLNSDIVDGEVYMGSGYGEFRSIYNKVDSTESGLVYAGVEGFNYVNHGDVNFAGMVSQTPNIDSMYSVGLNESGQIVIGFTQNGQTQESTDWSVVVGSLNTDMTVNGLFANTTTTVIGSGLSSWTFGNDGNLTAPGTITSPNLIVDDGNISFLGNGSGIQGAMSFNLSTNNFTNNWNFSEDGNLTLPGSGVVSDTNGTPGLTRKTYTAVTGWFNNDSTWFSTNATLASTTVITGTIQGLSTETPGYAEQLYGYFKAPSTATYTFGLHVDDAGMFWIGDDAVDGSFDDANADITYVWPNTVATYSVALTKDVYYPIRIQWGNNDGTAPNFGSLNEFWYSTDGGTTTQTNFINTIYTEAGLTTISKGGNEWAFGTDGDLTLPTGGEIKSAAGTGDVVIEANDGTARIWTFGSDGTTAFPGYTFEANDGTAGQVLATNGDGSVTWTTPIAATGNANTGDFTFVDTTLAASTNQDIVLQTNGKDWVFGGTGSLTLPTEGGAEIKTSDASNIDLFTNNWNGNGVEVYLVHDDGVYIYTANGDKGWAFKKDGNLTLPAGSDIRDETSNISVLKTRIGDTWSTASNIHQLTIANDEGKLITVAGTGVGVFRLPQMTADMLGAEFEFYFSIDAGQIHIQSYYTGVRETTDVFRGSIYVGVDNATTGKLHKATATTSTACDLFLGQHHAKAGSYIKVKAIAFDVVGTWMFQGMCIGDTGQTPNSSDHPFQDYN